MHVVAAMITLHRVSHHVDQLTILEVISHVPKADASSTTTSIIESSSAKSSFTTPISDAVSLSYGRVDRSKNAAS